MLHPIFKVLLKHHLFQFSAESLISFHLVACHKSNGNGTGNHKDPRVKTNFATPFPSVSLTLPHISNTSLLLLLRFIINGKGK